MENTKSNRTEMVCVACFQVILTVILALNFTELGVSALAAGIAFGVFSVGLDLIIYRFFKTVQGKVALEEEINQLYKIRANELDYGNIADAHIKDVERMSSELQERIESSMRVLEHSLDSETGYGEAEQILKGMEETIKDCRFIRYCDNSVVNALLNEKVQAALKGSFVIKADCRIPQSVSLQEYEICSLFENIINAALGMLEKYPADDRTLVVAADVRAEKLAVRVSWNTGTEIEKNLDKKVGLKKSIWCSELAMVQKLVDKYSGTLTVNQENGQVFIVAVL